MSNKQFFFIFEVIGVQNNMCSDGRGLRMRHFIGKEATFDPKSTYIGEDTSWALQSAITKLSRDRFVKKIIQVCSSQEELDAAYENYVRFMSLYSTKYYALGIPKHIQKQEVKPDIAEAEPQINSSKSHLTWLTR